MFKIKIKFLMDCVSISFLVGKTCPQSKGFESNLRNMLFWKYKQNLVILLFNCTAFYMTNIFIFKHYLFGTSQRLSGIVRGFYPNFTEARRCYCLTCLRSPGLYISKSGIKTDLWVLPTIWKPFKHALSFLAFLPSILLSPFWTWQEGNWIMETNSEIQRGF